MKFTRCFITILLAAIVTSSAIPLNAEGDSDARLTRREAGATADAIMGTMMTIFSSLASMYAGGDDKITPINRMSLQVISSIISGISNLIHSRQKTATTISGVAGDPAGGQPLPGAVPGMSNGQIQ
ncbi:hypothetical protein TWF694_002689 [Orbilia ellipsospora]|uniref:Uncharacterized protein n=1 Tax=Orbilia ellipsospora TaxID=2528407 RepID=A0AAV9X5B3_9PEZI